MATSLSDIKQSDIEFELASNLDYAALSAAQKLQLSNTAVQAINNMSVAAAESEYVLDNMAAGTPLVIGPGHMSGILLAVDEVAGQEVTFDTPFPTSIIATGDYVCQARGFSALGADVHVTIEMAAGSVTFYPAADDTNIFYLITPVL